MLRNRGTIIPRPQVSLFLFVRCLRRVRPAADLEPEVGLCFTHTNLFVATVTYWFFSFFFHGFYLSLSLNLAHAHTLDLSVMCQAGQHSTFYLCEQKWCTRICIFDWLAQRRPLVIRSPEMDINIRSLILHWSPMRRSMQSDNSFSLVNLAFSDSACWPGPFWWWEQIRKNGVNTITIISK